MLFFLLFGLLLSTANCEAYEDLSLKNVLPGDASQSNIQLDKLAKAEFGIVVSLQQFVVDMSDNSSIDTCTQDLVDAVQTYLNDFRDSSGKLQNTTTEAQIQKIVGHPLLVFRMLFRLQIDAELIREKSLSVASKLNFEDLEIEWPAVSHSALPEIMDSILHLCFIYDLDVEEFANGKIHGIETGITLDSRHIATLGKYAMDKYNYHALAVEWLELAKGMSFTKTGDTNFPLDDVLKQAVEQHDWAFDRTLSYSNLFFVRKIVQRKDSPYVFSGIVRRLKQRTRDGDMYAGIPNLRYADMTYWELCKGKNFQSESTKSSLYCWHDTGLNSIWRLSPLKVEIISTSPKVIQIYDVISAKDTGELIRSAEPTLQPSVVVSAKGGFEKSSKRTSFSTWLPSANYPISIKVSKVIELITGLKVGNWNAAEDLQLASYTIGGFYQYHVDSPGKQIPLFKEKGDRIATFMFYLSDVSAGGQTAFINAGVSATPVKGSAVFWFNLDGAGEIDLNTYHGACPVLLGGPKWVDTVQCSVPATGVSCGLYIANNQTPSLK